MSFVPPKATRAFVVAEQVLRDIALDVHHVDPHGCRYGTTEDFGCFADIFAI
jgi:hypothetical protein